jgi:hypothetical protein
MASFSVEFGGSKTKVNQLSAYKVEEDGQDRLVLRAKKIGYYLGGGVLAVMGIGLSAVGFLAVAPDNRGVGVGLGLSGLLLLAGAAALVRAGARNNDRIVFDRAAAQVRFDMTREKDRHAIAFATLDRVELRMKDQSTMSESRILFPVFLVSKGGDETKVDEATDVAQMLELGLKASHLCGVPFVDTLSGKSGGREADAGGRR